MLTESIVFRKDLKRLKYLETYLRYVISDVYILYECTSSKYQQVEKFINTSYQSYRNNYYRNITNYMFFGS